MTTITAPSTMIDSPFESASFDEAQLAAVSFLARYGGRTLEAYRHDLRVFFQLQVCERPPRRASRTSCAGPSGR